MSHLNRLTVRPSNLDEARYYVRKWHSHNKEFEGYMWALACEYTNGDVLGLAVIGRPVAAGLQDGRTIEVNRLATPGLRADRRCWGVASLLLRCAWSAAWAMGVRRGVSYTRKGESGACYAAAGWVPAAHVRGRPWPERRGKQRFLPGLEKPVDIIDKTRWEAPRLEIVQ